MLAALTAGGALGFLRHGFPPASSFMGDTGSNLLGYLLAAVAVQGALKTNAVVALSFPLVVLAVPILDTGFVVAKRLKYRQPIYQADRWHFHHRMANIGFSQRRTLAYLYGWTLVMAGLALALRFVPYSDDHGNFDAGWTAVMIVCAGRRARGELLPRLRPRDPQAAAVPPAPGSPARGGRAAPERGGRRGRRARARDRQLPGRRPGDRRVRGGRPASAARPDAAAVAERAARRRAPRSAIFAPRRHRAGAVARRDWAALSLPVRQLATAIAWPLDFDSPDDREPSDEGGRRHGRHAAGRRDAGSAVPPGAGSARWSVSPSRSASLGLFAGLLAGLCPCLRSL